MKNPPNKTSRTPALALACAAALALASTASAQRGPRVVGGTNAPEGAYPWMTAMMTKGQSGFNAQFCGAALIDRNWVVTAAHCVERETVNSMDVLVGGYNLNQSGGVRVAVRRIISHPNYGEANDGSVRNDIALLELATPVDSITPIPLVDAAALIAPGTTAKGMGWGATREGGSGSAILQHVDLPLLSLAQTQQSYSGVDSSGLGAGWPNGGRDTCQGDSGGPLVVPDGNGGWKLAGVVSFGDGCARPGSPGVYANVLNLRDWVLQTSGIGGGTGGGDNGGGDNGGGDNGGGDNGGGDNGGGDNGADDHGDTLSDATVLAVPSTTSGSLETGGDVDIFRIEVAGGPVTVTTSGDTDTYGYLVDEADQVIAEDDDSGQDYNFAIEADLEPGTYFVVVEGYDEQTTGRYDLAVDGDGDQSETAPDIVVIYGGADVNGIGEIPFAAVEIPGSSNLDLTVLNRGDAVLVVDGASLEGADADQFAISTTPADEVDPSRSTVVTVTYDPSEAGSHTAELVIASNDEDEPEVRIALTGEATEAPTSGGGDDHADDLEGATLVDLGSRTDGMLDLGDVDVFEFTVDQRRRVIVQTRGEVDTYGLLLDDEGYVIAENDDSGRGFNFRMRRRLNPGTYYVVVEGFDEFEEGEYSLRVR